MLRKRTRSNQTDQLMGHIAIPDSSSESYFSSDVSGQNHRSSSLFSVPGLFVGLSPKGLSDGDSVRSPTSPLDFRGFLNRGNISSRSPRYQKTWGASKVGLSIVDSLDDENKLSGKVLRASESKNILFGPQMRSKTVNHQTHTNSFELPQSLPKEYSIFPHTRFKSPLYKGNSDVVFEIGDTPSEPEPFGKIRSCSLDSGRSFLHPSGLADLNPKMSSSQISSPQLIGGSPKGTNLDSISVSIGSCNGFTENLSPSEIELSEDYTCVISHGPNPKTTHIYGDCILECHTNELGNNLVKSEEKGALLSLAIANSAPAYPSDNFLSFCYACNKKLEEGKDIYMYRGEKAFCSLDCRSQEIMVDEEMEKNANISSENPVVLDNDEELFETGIVAT